MINFQTAINTLGEIQEKLSTDAAAAVLLSDMTKAKALWAVQDQVTAQIDALMAAEYEHQKAIADTCVITAETLEI